MRRLALFCLLLPVFAHAADESNSVSWAEVTVRSSGFLRNKFIIEATIDGTPVQMYCVRQVNNANPERPPESRTCFMPAPTKYHSMIIRLSGADHFIVILQAKIEDNGKLADGVYFAREEIQ